MNRIKKIYTLLIFVIVATASCYAQSSPPVTATGQIFAEIIPVFTASETSQLNFGRFSPGPQGGEIILTPQSSLMLLGSIFKGSGLISAASFYVTGEDNATYSITLPSSPVILTNTTNARTLQIINWVSDPQAGVATGNLQNGGQTVYVGATLKVGTLNDNPVGLYTGTFTVTFEFN
jgi:hypothetical protein